MPRLQDYLVHKNELEYWIERGWNEVDALVELGKRMGISGPHTWRLRNEAYNKLRELLMVDERILDIIGE